MKRITTDNPQLNIERLLNTARAENNQAVLHIGDEVITLAEYVAKCAKERGCDVTQESVMDGDNCVECDCPIAILNILGIQAAENNARLKMIEKILGNDYDLDRLKELAEADREGRIDQIPSADVAPVVHAKWEFNGICTSCSACGSNKPTKAHDHKLASREVRFCYFCGAKMDLEEQTV